MSEASTIDKALHTFLATHLQDDETRKFFRLDGFDEAIYRGLLTRIRADGDTLAGCPLWVRTTGPLPGYEGYALEEGKSATWYRNHVPLGHALVLVFNLRTSDAQSLKDIYPVTESLLAAEGLEHLITAAFTDYELSNTQIEVLTNFLARLRRALFQPQLRDLVAFMTALNAYLHDCTGTTMETAIAESLPYLGLFRCRELVDMLNTPKGDRLLCDLHRAARLGQELLDENQLNTYLRRLQDAEFDDDSAYGGLPQEGKRDLLHSFLTEVLTDRADVLSVLQVDWREVAPVLYKSRRKTPAERMQELATALEEALKSQGLQQDSLPERTQDVLQDLADGQEPEDEGLDTLLTDYGDSLPKSLRNTLRRLQGFRRHQTTDFVAGITRLAVELLASLQDDLPEGASLHVRFDERALERITPKEAEALPAFRTLHGGVEAMMSHVQWDLNPLWILARRHAARVGDEEQEEEGERGKRIIGRTSPPLQLGRLLRHHCGPLSLGGHFPRHGRGHTLLLGTGHPAPTQPHRLFLVSGAGHCRAPPDRQPGDASAWHARGIPLPGGAAAG